MATTAPSRILCITCNKYHMNSTQEAAPRLFALGLNANQVQMLQTAGDDAAAAHNQPTKHKTITPADEHRMRTMLGMSDNDIDTLKADAARIALEDIDEEIIDVAALEFERLATAESFAEVREALDEMLADIHKETEFARKVRRRAIDKERQRRYRELHKAE